MFSYSHSKLCGPIGLLPSRVIGAAMFTLVGCAAGLSTGCVARSESDVVVYVSVDQEFSMPILQAFERTTEGATHVVGKYDVESTKTVGLVNEIIAESSRPVCDVFWNNEMLHTIRLQKMGLLEPHDWKVAGNFPPDMIAEDGTWCGFAARARILMINTELLPDPDQWPRSVDDLRDPRWADQCAMARPMVGTAATHFALLASVHGEEATLDTIRQIQSNARILSGNKQVALAISAGQLAWGLTDTDDAIVEKDAGFPIAIVFPDQQPDQPGTLRIPNTAMILRDAPHPVAAAQVVDYLVTPETEDRLAMGNSAQIPLNTGAKFPPRVLPDEPIRWMRSDFEAAADGWDSWAKKVATLFE